MKNSLLFLSNESGTTKIEYALIGTLVAIAALVAFGIIGNSVNSSLTNTSEEAARAMR